MEIKICQINTHVGNFLDNIGKIEVIAAESTENQILVFPELTVPGYPLLDLADNATFITQQESYVDEILRRTRSYKCLLIFGYAERNLGPGKSLFNTAVVAQSGKIIYRYRKRLLPTYDVFDEARYFEPGKKMGLFHYKGKHIGLVICEDLFFRNKLYSINPVEDLFNAHAEFIISINGSPSVVGKYEEKVEMMKDISKTYAMPIVYVNQVGGNDDIVFDGNSFVTNGKGVIVHKSKKFEEDISIIKEEVLSYCTVGMAPEGLSHEDVFETHSQFFYEQGVYGIKEYVEKCGFKGVVIGESGGIDSAVVTSLAVNALGADKVVGITMPSEFSSEGSFKDSEVLCANYGTRFFTYPIKDVFQLISGNFNNIFGDAEFGLTEENLQARIRGEILMAYSNRTGYLVLSTGNKSELSVGYCTIYGDMCGGFAPISGLYKMEVFGVGEYENQLKGKEMIPRAILDKAPSAELAPGQKDTDSLPPYPVLDAILKLLIEGDVLNEDEKELCNRIIRDNKSENEIKRISKMLKRAEFKRRQAAIGIKMHRKDFGFGRRIPVAQGWEG